MKHVIGAAIAAAFFVAMPAQAADKSEKSSSSGATREASREFSELDKNKDGYISKDEAKGSEHEKDFAKYDKNKDGKLSKQEFSAAEKAEQAGSGGTHRERDEKKKE